VTRTQLKQSLNNSLYTTDGTRRGKNQPHCESNVEQVKATPSRDAGDGEI